MNKLIYQHVNNNQRNDRIVPLAGLILMFAWFCGIVIYGGYAASQSQASKTVQAYKVKTAFLYNFIRFVDWPEEKMADKDKPIVIGVLGKDSFGDALEAIPDKKPKGKDVVIKRFKSFEELKKSANKNELDQEIKAIGECHLLFICDSEKAYLSEITASIKKYNILTVGEITGLLDNGGIINFTVLNNKIRFDINTIAAKESHLKIRSQLLRLANIVVKGEGTTEADYTSDGNSREATGEDGPQ
jgi:hypothetical protein